MFWDKISPIYDAFLGIYNGKVYRETGEKVAEFIGNEDVVLECACGTGAISEYIAQKCKKLVATDYASGMLRQTAKKCRILYRGWTYALCHSGDPEERELKKDELFHTSIRQTGRWIWQISLRDHEPVE